ncbi:TonB-dependent receptor [Thiomicrorhabdus sp. ZW0627]|uniref:TonB-dependent receptor n=1 Tax=Thiomicrorhabdus sp. ZW0627 TaxID=3039774 RepID=UPI002436F5A0|nr:TonB-dependent receptor [Thiomicrorhabdus sp. ZW0627]MDG6774107.1 TonB-dependent receptor [Thiomicrorhabdus sp. ZW0627]
MKIKPLAIAIATALSATNVAAEELAPVVVNADLRETTEQDIPTSVDIKDSADLQDQGAVHFDDILLKTPNVNFSGQSSRPRHIQIRGIGQRDEYTGAPNASVGFAIDDIDFSGIGMVGNLFDVQQVEVLRGPQNTRYGQSAIGGLINIETNDSTPYRESMIEASAGQDNLKEFGLMTSGPVSSEEDAAQYRIAVFKHSSDGFRDNDTLNRTDTNGRDELTVRGKVRLFPNKNTTVDVSMLHADLNNGYDAWSRDNSFTTLSNQPGKDSQLSNAGSIKAEWKGNPNYVLTSKTTLANSDMTYSYDEDWTADSAGTYLNNKHRRTMSQELRWTSTPESRINGNTDWLFGLYGSKLDETNKTEYWGSSSSDFTLSKLAGFGQLDYAMTPKATITAGLRIEQNSSDFTNSAGEHYTPDDGLWGANLTYRYKYNDTHTAFTGITRGYKAGGFNAGQPSGTPSQYITYDAETLMNYEIGLKSNYAALGLKTNITAFYMDRQNPQFDGYTYDPNSSTAWVFYTENFDGAQNYGLEGDFEWQANSNWNLYGSLGLLQTKVEGTALNTGFTISDREQAHAPNYQFNLGVKYRASNGFYAQGDVTAVDKFYFDNTHNIESDPYHLVNARIGYETENYEIYLWGKNLTDETYATRGYYFDFNAPYTNPSEYIRLGDLRQLGVTARVFF